MSKALEKLQNCMRCIREKTDFQPEVALILGSGLGDYAESIDIRAEVSYREIEGFPVSTVPGHKGRFVFGYVNQVPVVIMQGRVHYYEGYSMEEVVLPIRLMGMMGARKLLLDRSLKDRAKEIIGRMQYVQFGAVEDFIQLMAAAKAIPHTDLKRFPSVERRLEERSKGDL